MLVEVNNIINDFLSAENVGVTCYLFQAPTASSTYIVLTPVSDTPTHTKENDINIPGKARLQFSIFSNSFQTANSIKRKLLKCLRSTTNTTDGAVTWIFTRDNFTEQIFTKETQRYQIIIDFFIDYLDGTT